jgi:hypothetical protein
MPVECETSPENVIVGAVVVIGGCHSIPKKLLTGKLKAVCSEQLTDAEKT